MIYKEKTQQQAQKNLNKRLDKLYFKNLTGSEFDTTIPHNTRQISIVTRDSGVELYKGDIRIFLGKKESKHYILYADYLAL